MCWVYTISHFKCFIWKKCFILFYCIIKTHTSIYSYFYSHNMFIWWKSHIHDILILYQCGGVFSGEQCCQMVCQIFHLIIRNSTFPRWNVIIQTSRSASCTITGVHCIIKIPFSASCVFSLWSHSSSCNRASLSLREPLEVHVASCAWLLQSDWGSVFTWGPLHHYVTLLQSDSWIWGIKLETFFPSNSRG